MRDRRAVRVGQITGHYELYVLPYIADVTIYHQGVRPSQRVIQLYSRPSTAQVTFSDDPRSDPVSLNQTCRLKADQWTAKEEGGRIIVTRTEYGYLPASSD